MYKLIDWPVFCKFVEHKKPVFCFLCRLLVFLNIEYKGMTSLFGFAGEIDFTYGAIDKSDETECGYIKLNS